MMHTPDNPAPPPPPAPHAAPPAAATTNGYAVAALVLGILGWTMLPWLGSLGAVIFGHVARAQIRRAQPPEQGDGLALAGLVLGWAMLALSVIGVIFALIFVLFFGGLAWLAAIA